MSDPKQQAVSFVRSRDFRNTYVNGLRIRVTPFDFVVTLGSNIDVPGSPVPIVQDEVSISMPLGFAKVFALNITHAIEAAESVLGKIQIPEQNVPGDQMRENIRNSLLGIKMTT